MNETVNILDAIKRLNPQQRKAVEAVDGPLLIMAGAGSGKTRVLTHRIAYLIGKRKAAPWSILAITFTNKAAREMQERVGKLVGGSGQRYLGIHVSLHVCAHSAQGYFTDRLYLEFHHSGFRRPAVRHQNC